MYLDLKDVMNTRPRRIAVIPTRNRHIMLKNCIESIVHQVDAIVVVDNLSQPPLFFDPIYHGSTTEMHVVRIDIDPPSISQLWNIGIMIATKNAELYGASEFDIAVLNSDVIIPAMWMSRMSKLMRNTTAVLAYPDQFNGSLNMLHTEAKPINLYHRITGYAYVLRGEAGLQLDESMRWWYSDDDLDWTARQKGGSLLVTGCAVQHLDPNGSTNARPELQEQARRDRETFINKWGRAPH